MRLRVHWVLVTFLLRQDNLFCLVHIRIISMRHFQWAPQQMLMWRNHRNITLIQPFFYWNFTKGQLSPQWDRVCIENTFYQWMQRWNQVRNLTWSEHYLVTMLNGLCPSPFGQISILTEISSIPQFKYKSSSEFFCPVLIQGLSVRLFFLNIHHIIRSQLILIYSFEKRVYKLCLFKINRICSYLSVIFKALVTLRDSAGLSVPSLVTYAKSTKLLFNGTYRFRKLILFFRKSAAALLSQYIIKPHI